MQTALELNVHAVKRLIDEQADFLLLDCRQPEEFSICHIEGATLIPMNEIPERRIEIADWEGRPVIVVCHRGVRSLNVAHWLRDNGFLMAQSMSGGMDAWSQHIDPSIPRYA